MTLKLLQDNRVFNVNVSFIFLNVHSLDSNNELQHSHRKSWHFLTSTSSLLNSAFVSSFLSLSCCLLLLVSLMLSNPGTLFLPMTSTEFLIALYAGGLFGLNVEINVKTSSVSYVHFELFKAFLIPFVIILRE